jgi:hypothetical protein
LVVDVLEVIQIHHQHRHRRLVALAALEFARSLLQEMATVVQPGQLVHGGQLDQLFSCWSRCRAMAVMCELR